MQTSECSVVAEAPFLVDLAHEEGRKKIKSLGEKLAAQRHLHYEGYIAFTDTPYDIEHARTTLFFN